MTPRLSRLAATLVLAVPLVALPTHAQTAPPSEADAVLKAAHVDKAKGASYADENGKAITEEEFMREQRAGKPFVTMKKLRPGGDPEVTLALTTKEALAAMDKRLKKIPPGTAFPEFKLARLDGTMLDNQALKGRYTLVNFYFAQCAPCVQEVPELNALAKGRRDVNFVGITFDSAADTKQFVADTGFAWPLLPGARAVTLAAGVMAYPSFALLDPHGKVVDFEFGDKLHAGGGSVAGWLDKALAAAKQ